MTYVMDDRLKEAAEDADWEKALKDITVAITKEKGKAVEVAKKKAHAFEKARALVEKRLTEMEVKLGGIELKLVEEESLNLTQADEIADLKAALEACEEKWYNEGFADVENSVEPIVYQARKHGFREGWMAALQAMEVPNDSPLRNPDQVPFPDPSPLVQYPPGAADEEETPNMRELVWAIDSHMELVDLEVTSNLCAGTQSTEDVQTQPPPTT